MSCEPCKQIRRRMLLKAAPAALAFFTVADKVFAKLPEGMQPGPYAPWFRGLVDGGGNSCCETSEGHRLLGVGQPNEHGDKWRWFEGKQPYGDTDPKSPNYVQAEFFKYGQWFPITTKMISVRDTLNNKPADQTNPTGNTLIWYSDYPNEDGVHGSVNIFCFIPGPEF